MENKVIQLKALDLNPQTGLQNARRLVVLAAALALPKAQPVRPAMEDKAGFKLLANLGKENTFGELQRASDAVSNYYRANGYFVARAYLPQQEIQGGVIEIAVLEGTVGSVVQEKALERASLLANDLPAMAASVSLDPGANTGETNVTLEATEGKMFSASADVDNYGSRFTGAVRLGLTLNLNSPLGMGDQFSLRLMATDEKMALGRVSYQVPVDGNGTRIGAA